MSIQSLDTEVFISPEVYFLAFPLPSHLCQCFNFEIVEFKASLDIFLFDPKNIA